MITLPPQLGRLEVREDNDQLELVLPTDRKKGATKAPMALAWNVFLLFWYSGVLAGGGMAGVPMALFGIPHVLVGLGLIYATAVGLLNRTRITLGPGKLQVTSGPVPAGGNGVHRRSDLVQLFVIRREPSPWTAWMQNHKKTTDPDARGFQVCAVTPDGSAVTLVSHVEGLVEARAIERTLGGVRPARACVGTGELTTLTAPRPAPPRSSRRHPA